MFSPSAALYFRKEGGDAAQDVESSLTHSLMNLFTVFEGLGDLARPNPRFDIRPYGGGPSYERRAEGCTQYAGVEVAGIGRYESLAWRCRLGTWSIEVAECAPHICRCG